MNISYSSLQSSINKDVVVYENQYGLSGDDQRNYNTGQTPNSIFQCEYPDHETRSRDSSKP